MLQLFNQKTFLLSFLIILALLYCLVVFSHIFYKKNATEGFKNENGEPYILKQNQNIYDTFYAELFNQLPASTSKQADDKINIITNEIKMNKNNIILEIETRTGENIAKLNTLGFKYIFGIETSKKMVNKSKNKQIISQANPSERLTFDANTFSHILCIQPFAFYEITDPLLFFQNAVFWLKEYLVISLIEITTPTTTTQTIKFPAVIIEKGEKSKDTEKIEYTQIMSLDIKKQPSVLIIRETFKNVNADDNSAVRENERIISIIDTKDIIKQAKNAGLDFVKKIEIDNKKNDNKSIEQNNTLEKLFTDYLFFFKKI